MLTLEFILKNKEVFEQSMKKRGALFNLEVFERFKSERQALILKTEELQEKRNKIAKEIANVYERCRKNKKFQISITYDEALPLKINNPDKNRKATYREYLKSSKSPSNC